jgi:thymidylate synthase
MLKNLTKQNHIPRFLNVDDSIKPHEEYQYLNLINEILTEGSFEEGRNGITKCIFGAAMHFSLENNKIPILTTKKTAWKTCLKELLWFIKGKTDNKLLTDQNVHIWDGNSSKEFLKTRNLSHYKEGDLGPIYGFQWRYFDAKYNNCDDDYKNKGIDQLLNVINTLKNSSSRTSRRMIVTAWNPNQIDQMALPPCHIMFQFNVIDENKLSCSLYQRSVDCPLGQPFNIASYSFLTHLIAKHCDLKAYEFIYYMGNAHIYNDHIDEIKTQLNRTPYEFPSIEILNKKDNIDDYEFSDFKIKNYKHHDQIKMNMVV